MKSVCIKIQKGEPVIEIGGRKRRGVIEDFELTPNGRNSPGIVAVLHVKFDDGGVVATSDKFKPVDDFEYSEFFPSAMLGN